MSLIVRYSFTADSSQGTSPTPITPNVSLSSFTRVSVFTNQPASDIGSLYIEDDGSIIKSTFRVKNPQAPVSSFVLSSPPTKGTAVITYEGPKTSILGYPMEVGTWTYTPNPDYNEEDTFEITVNYADSSESQIIPISVSVTLEEQDAFDDIEIINLSSGAFIDINTGDNDRFEATTLTYSVLTNPSSGTVQVIDASNGTFRYTPAQGFIGTDSFKYQVQPTGGSSESATVVVNVTATSIFLIIENGDNLTLEDGTFLILEQ